MREQVRRLIHEKKIEWPNIVLDDINRIVEQYHIAIYPTGILIGPDGKVLDADVKDLNSVLKSLL